jgi:hypothetical protein
MEFTDYTSAWAKSEVLQGRIMIGIGIFLSIVFVAILRSDNALLRGSIIPLSLLLALLLGYGSYMLYSRPAHAKEIIRLHQKFPDKAIKHEKAKHINDNKTGKVLMRVYPLLMLVSIGALILASAPHYKGMAVGFALLFIAMFLIDNGFVSRSERFLSFLKELQ